MTEYAIQIRGNTIKIAGLSIIRIPKDKTCIINGFHIEDGEIIKNGELMFVPKQGNLMYQITNNVIKFSRE
jgi:hypothetical protein